MVQSRLHPKFPPPHPWSLVLILIKSKFWPSGRIGLHTFWTFRYRVRISEMQVFRNPWFFCFYWWVWGDDVRDGRKVCFSGKKMGVPLINFFKKLGVSPNHQIFRLRHRTAEAERGYPQFKKKTIRGTPIFFPEKQTFLFSRSGNLITLTVVTFSNSYTVGSHHYRMDFISFMGAFINGNPEALRLQTHF